MDEKEECKKKIQELETKIQELETKNNKLESEKEKRNKRLEEFRKFTLKSIIGSLTFLFSPSLQTL